MKTILIFSLILIQSCIAFAQNSCPNDSSVRVLKAALSKKWAPTYLYYFNDEWLMVPDLDIVPTDSIQKIEIKDDKYGNCAAFFTVTPATLEKLKSEYGNPWYTPRDICEFPGGDQKLYKWLKANIQVPEDFIGFKKVIVQFYVKSDGSVTDPEILRPSKNEAANTEALRLVSSFPKFWVKYRVPDETRFHFDIPITFTEPGKTYYRATETSFERALPKIEVKIRQLYENVVFQTANDPDFKITDICTDDFLQRFENASSSDQRAHIKWFLRPDIEENPIVEVDVKLPSGGYRREYVPYSSIDVSEDQPTKVVSVIPGVHNTAIVNWEYKKQKGRTSLAMIQSDGVWKINDNIKPEY